MNDKERQADTGNLIADKVIEIEELKKAGAALMQAAVRKVNKPEVGTMMHDPATGKFRRVDAMLIDAIKTFGKLLGISVGEETEEEGLDRRAREGTSGKIEVVPNRDT